MIDKETLEEASIRLVPNRTLKTPFGSPYEITPTRERNTFIKGAKWQAERMFTYDELRRIAYNAYCIGQLEEPTENKYNLWIQQFKNK